MSLQDDYFDLDSRLKGADKRALQRIWNAFLELDRKNEELLPIVNHIKSAIQLMFNMEE